jgi:hypothetical protein
MAGVNIQVLNTVISVKSRTGSSRKSLGKLTANGVAVTHVIGMIIGGIRGNNDRS